MEGFQLLPLQVGSVQNLEDAPSLITGTNTHVQLEKKNALFAEKQYGRSPNPDIMTTENHSLKLKLLLDSTIYEHSVNREKTT